MSLFDQIGPDFVKRAITEFYDRAFTDPMIGHFFFNKEKDVLTAKQIAFARGLLGGPAGYDGKPLEEVHYKLPIRTPHFMRRQMLLKEVLDEMELAENLRDEWLAREERLRGLIMDPSKPSFC